MHVLGSTNPQEPPSAFNPAHLHVTTHPSYKVPRIYCPPEANISVQVIMFHRPHPTRMEYMSLDPISLALGDKASIADKPEVVPSTIDAEEERDRAVRGKLVEKLKLHTVVKHMPSPKEQALPLIINQVNCAYEMGKLMEKNSHLIGIRVKRSMSVGERVVESATTLWTSLSSVSHMCSGSGSGRWPLVFSSSASSSIARLPRLFCRYLSGELVLMQLL